MIAALALGAALGAALGSAHAAAPARFPACADLSPDAWGPEAQERVGLWKNTAWLFLRAYKVGASKGDGDRCGMHPSCSAYTWQAVQRNGPLLGGWLGAGRILASHRDPALPLCRDGERLLRVDLPEEGELWRRSP